MTAGPIAFVFPAGEWLQHRACVDVDPDVFFVERGQSTAAAKAICATCPVRQDCLGYALDNNEDAGVWGGTTPRERRAIRRSRRRLRIINHGTAAGYQAHMRRGEDACAACKAGHANYRATQRAIAS